MCSSCGIHDYIPGAHVNEHTLLDNVMLKCTPVFEYYIARIVVVIGH